MEFMIRSYFSRWDYFSYRYVQLVTSKR